MTTTIACDAILFDCDGVLVDSTVTAEEEWSRWAVHYGLDPAEVLVGLHGRRSIDTVGLFLPVERQAEGFAAIEAFAIAAAATNPAIPGAGALLAALPPIWAVVTSASRPLALARVAGAGLPAPRVLVTAEDVRAGKPDPEGYLLAAARLGVPTAACLVVEDSRAGIEAARRAGAGHVLGVGADALSSDAETVVDDLLGCAWNGSALHVDEELRRPLV